MAEITRKAGRLLGQRLDDMIVVRRGGRNIVLRARAGERDVFIKAACTAQHLLRTEIAALRWLNAHPVASALVPRLLCAEEESGMVVTETVPGAITLEQVLGGNDRHRAEVQWERTAEALGRLHGATAHERGSALATDTVTRAAQWREQREPIMAFLREAGVRPGAGWNDEFDVIVEELGEPGPWQGLSAGDLAPSNVLLAEDGVRFVDLEYAGWRHTAYDAVFWHTICPGPARLAERLDGIYASAANAAGRELSEAALRRGLTRLAAHRAFWSLTWGASKLCARDAEWVPGTGGRTLIRHWLKGFTDLAERGGEMPAFCEVARKLDAAFGACWPETNVARPLFPVWSAR